jgi:hypothetical protein
MKAWKFLAPGAIAPFTGVRWPLPDGSSAAPWLQGGLSEDAGVHACDLEHLPYWFDEELWEVELEAPISRTARQLVGARARLIGRIEEWPAAQTEFTGACVERTRRRVIDLLLAGARDHDARRVADERDLEALRETAATIAQSGPAVVGYLADVIRRSPYPGCCSYIAARAAVAIEGPHHDERERAAQVAWLVDRLALRDSA